MNKFKNTEELEKAYKELEKEFTKKSQKLAEVEKTNYVTLLHNEMDSLLDDYAKKRIAELAEQLSLTEKALELACKELRDYSCMQCNSCNRYEMCDYVLSLYPSNYFIEEAKEMMKSE